MDTVLFTDGRISDGTTGMSFSLNAPDAADVSSTAIVRDGDLKRVDIAARMPDLLVDPAELEARHYGAAPLISRNTSDVLTRLSHVVPARGHGALERVNDPERSL